jgi:DNA-binding CsgD family transcriptional regulator
VFACIYTVRMPDQRIDTVLDYLYQAATDPAGWPEFLSSAAKLFDASVSGFIVRPDGNSLYAITNILGMDSKAIQQYNEYFCATDPWYLAMRERGIAEWIGPGSALCSPSQFAETEFYNDYWAHTSPTFYQAGIIFRSFANSVVFTMQRERSQGDFDEDQTRLLGDIHLHLRRALVVHRRMLDLRQMADGAGSAIASLDVGLIGLDSGGTICFTNTLAESRLRESGLLGAHLGRLVVSGGGSCADDLAKLIRSALTRDRGHPPGGAITLRSATQALHLAVLPVVGSAIGLDRSCVFLTVTDPSAPERPRNVLLAELFDLTPAETRVTMMLVAGLDPGEIGERTRTTVATVRYQLKMIYRKTGVSRQSQLVRLVSTLPGSK